MIDTDSRLRVARGIDKTETLASIQVFETLKERGHPDKPPPTISDGWGGIDEAMITVYGKVPHYKGVGRPPTKKQPQSGWQYVQMVKQRSNGRVVGTKLRVIYGDHEEVIELLGQSTAYAERNHLTMRQFNGRLVRKGLGFSKLLKMYIASATWEDCIYNLGRGHKSLRREVNVEDSRLVGDDTQRRWEQRSPAMAAGLTDHIWNVKELLTTIVTPNT